ncbi:MAG: universal stress protein [Candidatus Devosia phytovorans]|uniref:Universal stress protein n=1 Tax=Candidatus Devosia phytovorans TaxID=3121372 RepID=A0AAJ5VR65_9HYPH|nr:universal stress protein [Devosia sp.]WEK02742.1 MAG: universal stress protein [Devosia sp.]
MYTRIVVGIDGSELATKALRHALVLGKEMNARLLVVTSTEPSVLVAPGSEFMAVDTSSVIPDMEEVKARSAEVTLNAARELAAASGLDIETQHVPASVAADAIVSAARENGADLIVMGSHGRRGLGRLLLGSQAAEVLAHSTIPVLVVK